MEPFFVPKIPTSVLLDSRTVVEKKDYVTTGILSFVEGDLIEIEIGEYKAFKLGDPVKLKIFTTAGTFSFISSVIAFDEGSIIVVNPQENQRKFTERREYPRVKTSQKGIIHSITHDSMREELALKEPLEVIIHNISLGGIGFRVPGGYDIWLESQLRMEIDLGSWMTCISQVVRKDSDDAGTVYGAKYLEVSPDKINSLRAFVLKTQVEARLASKRK